MNGRQAGWWSIKIAGAVRSAHWSRQSETGASHMADESTAIYKVIVNHEEQYSLWLEAQDTPVGWKAEGKTGTKEE
ncbi:MbtH family NRPS accessory protein [Streptomyces bacillaris]|uniref:MbtH family NRPS accessory protein n=1 Tax=Streptomyces bacillaris TaxID=68179 RepID=UPI0040635CA8